MLKTFFYLVKQLRKCRHFKYVYNKVAVRVVENANIIFFTPDILRIKQAFDVNVYAVIYIENAVIFL